MFIGFQSYFKLLLTGFFLFNISGISGQVNNTIFFGTVEDGYDAARYEQMTSNDIFTGSSGDGYDEACFEQMTSNDIFSGGFGDGYDAACFEQMTSNNIYSGSIGDGYGSFCLEQSTSNSIFAGSIGDGYSSFCLEQSTSNSIFAGSLGDGYDEGCYTLFIVPLTVSCPVDPNLESCLDEDSIQSAYNDWVNGFSVNDGCTGVTSNIGDIPSLPNFTLGAGIDLSFTLSAIDQCEDSSLMCTSTFTVAAAIDGNCLDCTVYDTAPVDLSKSFDPVNGVKDRVQLKWYKASPEIRYTDEDAAMCDIKFWKKRFLDPPTGNPIGPVIQNPDTVLIANAKKTYPDNSPREIFKWPVKYRADGVYNSKRAEPNFRYEWKVRCECGHEGTGPESPWSGIKIFNTPDFDPVTGIFTPPGGQELLSEYKLLSDNGFEFTLFPNPTDGTRLVIHCELDAGTEYDLRIYDAIGRLIYQEQFRFGKDRIHELNFQSSFLSQGVYSLQLSSGDLMEQQIFFVE